MLEDIVYKDYSKKSDIHGTVLYPAVMIAPVQKDVLTEIISNNEINSVFDPFHGSGTSLYEAMEISPDIKLIGCDINPLANLITKVKLKGVNTRTIENDFKKLKLLINSEQELIPLSFPKINKWFREDIIKSLLIVRTAIINIKNKQNRLFFWYMLCDIIRKYSNTRSSTYKLHIKQDEIINKLKNNLIKDYIKSIEDNIDKFDKKSNNFKLYKSDILMQMPKFKNSEFDVSITSPPYGDNKTTVPYGQFSMLPLQIIDSKDLVLDGWELNNYNIIDKESIGGQKKENTMTKYEMDLISPFLEKISDNKKDKVLNFFNDYFLFLRNLCRVTNKYIVMTLGNRTVDRVKIDLTEVTKKYLEHNTFYNIKTAQREILSKRTPHQTSKVDNKPVSSMNHEYVIVHKKI